MQCRQAWHVSHQAVVQDARLKVTVVNVKAHTSEDDVPEGHITQYHEQGNKVLDTNAGESAKLHQVAPDTITEIREDIMAARVPQCHLDINMTCAKEFPAGQPVSTG